MKVGDRVKTFDGCEGTITKRGLERFSKNVTPIWLVELSPGEPPFVAFYEDRLTLQTNPLVDLVAFKNRAGSKIPD